MDYEAIRIEASDRKKTVRYTGPNKAMHWTDTYNSMGAVLGDEPEQMNENGVIVGFMKVDMPWDEVIEIMVEDAGLMTTVAEEALRAPGELTILED